MTRLEFLLTAPVKEIIAPKKKRKTWEILLLVLGSPLWLSLLIAGFAVVLALYAALWAVVVSLWAVFGALAGCALAGIAGGIIMASTGHGLTGVAIIGAGITCAGLSIFMYYGCTAASQGSVWLAKKVVLSIKHGFIKKEDKE